MNQQVIEIEIDALQPNPLQPRGLVTPESLVDLVDSIKEHGILQPLVVAKTPAGYQIIAGERRWRASKMAGLATVPVIIKETSPQGMLEMAIVENVQRTDLNALDRAKSFERLLNEFNLTNIQISQRIGKSPAYISNTMRLLTLPDALKDGILTGLISEGHARALAAIEDPKSIIEAYKIIVKEAGSVRRAEELARKMRAQMGNQPRTIGISKKHEVSAEIDEDCRRLEEYFGGSQKAQVKISRSKASTRFVINLKGDQDETESQYQRILSIIGE